MGTVTKEFCRSGKKSELGEWWCLRPVIPLLENIRQKDWYEFKASLTYILSLRPVTCV